MKLRLRLGLVWTSTRPCIAIERQRDKRIPIPVVFFKDEIHFCVWFEAPDCVLQETKRLTRLSQRECMYSELFLSSMNYKDQQLESPWINRLLFLDLLFVKHMKPKRPPLRLLFSDKNKNNIFFIFKSPPLWLLFLDLKKEIFRFKKTFET